MTGYAVTFTVVDNATKNIDAINRRIAAMRAPLDRLSKQVTRFVDVSGLNKVAQGFEWIGKAAMGVFRSMSAILAPLGAITGAATLAGMVKLVASYADWAHTLVQTADSLGITSQELQRMQDATRLAGGNAEDMTAAMKALSAAMGDFALGRGNAAETAQAMNLLGIKMKDANGNLRDTAQVTREVIEAIAAMPNPVNRARLSAILLGGAGDKLVGTFRQSTMGLKGAYDAAGKYSELTDKQKRSLQLFTEAQGRLGVSFDHLGQQISAMLARDFGPLMTQFAAFVERNTPAILDAVDRMSKQFAAWLGSIKWENVQAGIDKFIGSLKWVINHLDEIKTAAEVIAGIFAIKWAVGIVQAIGAVTTAIGLTGGAAVGTGLAGALASVGLLAATLALKGDTPGAGTPATPEQQKRAADAATDINRREGYTGNFGQDLSTWVQKGFEAAWDRILRGPENIRPGYRPQSSPGGYLPGGATPAAFRPSGGAPPGGANLPATSAAPTGSGGGVSGGSGGGSGGIDAPAGTPIARSGLATVTSASGRKFQVDERFAANFQGFINDYEKSGGQIGPDSGTLGSRPNNASGHPVGAAIDINQIGRGVRSKRATSLDPRIEDELAKKWGFVSGNQWRSNDQGHFGIQSAEAARQALINNGVSLPNRAAGGASIMSGWNANNPLNLTPGKNWSGGSATTPGGLPIRVYKSMEDGIADNVRKLVEYQQQRHLQTVEQMAHMWNKTATPEYLNKIAKELGVQTNQPFDITDPAKAAAWIRGAQPQETGPGRLTEAQIAAGVNQGLAAPGAGYKTLTQEQLTGEKQSVPSPQAPVNGSVDVSITHKNAPPNSAVTATGSGSVNVAPVRVEHQDMANI